jgi:hypothetical protein
MRKGGTVMIRLRNYLLVSMLMLNMSNCAISQEKDERLSDVTEILTIIKEVYMDNSVRGAYKTADAAFHLRNRLKDGYTKDYLYPFLADSTFFPEYARPYWSDQMTEEELWEIRENYFKTAYYQWDDRFDDIILTSGVDPKYQDLKSKKRLSYPIFTKNGDKAVVFSEVVASVATLDILIFKKNPDNTWSLPIRIILGNRWGKK